MEQWKPIAGFEGLYEVSNTGVIRTQGRTIKTHRKGTEYMKSYPARTMKVCLGKDGYLILSLRKDGLVYHKSVHRLVAEAFIPNPDNLPCINHKSEIKTENNVENLEWCDAKYNNNYGGRTERSIAHKRKKVACYKDGVLVKAFISQAEAGREMGIDSSAICMCCKGKIQHSCGYEWKYIQ